MKKTLNIYWDHKGLICTGFADYDGERIRFCKGSLEAECDTFDCCEQSDCADGITLDMVWEDLEAAVDDNGCLDVTDITLI